MHSLGWDIWNAVQPKEFYKGFLRRSIRPDGRKLSEYRDITLRKGPLVTTVDGSANASIGRTVALIGIQPKVIEWKETKKGSARSIVGQHCSLQVEFPSVCHRDIRSGRTLEEALLVKESLENVLEQILERDSFCIVPDKFYWHLQITAYCLSLDGNVIETFLLALYGALLDLQLPVVRASTSGDLLTLDPNQPKVTLPMKKLEDWPWVVPIGLFWNGPSEYYAVLDLSEEEENNMSSIVWIWNSQRGDKLAISKQKVGPLSVNILQEVLQLVKAHIDEVILRLQHGK
ncbi:exosome complex component RRP43 [Galdieria sulphuraria]|uniref:Ribosomal RNA-processing protein 43 n=1 Tax=Galdieria sulphuraria TaxID=130081 RepID=M2X360_GALSU|nr:exosome complex component RRP43 [Galdieria sulphuraria]EME30815.1 exosome complex component RRP43 [Galdieria sulphuraria]|eukprot:XP_005707335.1 exosome complex component RRP43 [Galdieria sulphuraria]